MKTILLLSTLAATFLVVTAGWEDYTTPPFYIPPTFPPPYRFRREANPQATGTVTLNQGKTPTLNLDYQHNILHNQNGGLTGGLSAQKVPSQKWDASARLQGAYQVGNGQLNGGIFKPLTGPDRNPTLSAGYSHNIWQSRNGQISAGVSAMKFPHQNWQPHFGIQGSWNLPG